jgi:PAS domain S-box-containing protein
VMEAASTIPVTIEYRIRRADGSTRYLRDRWRAIPGPSGSTAYVAAVAEDVTLRRARAATALRDAEARLRSARARLRSATEAAAIATWSWQTADDRAVGDERMAAMFGIPPEEAAAGVPRERFYGAIHEDDLPHVEERVRKAIDGEQPFRADYRVRAPDGSYRWVLSRGQVERDATGRPVGLLGAVVDVTEQKEAEAARRESEERLRAALAAKDDFLGLVSHELRTPMTLILGMSRVLAHQRVQPAQAREMAADIADSAETLSGLVDSILMLARLDQEEAGRAREPVLLHHTATWVVHRHQQRDESRRYDLRMGSMDTLVEVDEAWLERVIDDLLGNAAKYSDPGMPVTVEVSAAGGEVQLRVLDHGRGLADEEIARVFEPFYRAPGSSDRGHGVGLGLAVSKRIVELLGGRIWARRRDDTAGSEFGFALPGLRVGDD